MEGMKRFDVQFLHSIVERLQYHPQAIVRQRSSHAESRHEGEGENVSINSNNRILKTSK